MILRPFLLLLSCFFWPLLASAQLGALHTKAQLVSDVATVEPGQSFWLALRLDSQPKWHTYWVNPGEAGFATTLQWEEKPEGFEIEESFLWPAPIFYLQGGIVSYVYERQTVLLLRARAPESLAPGQELTFKARADWLECDDKGCWPGGADVLLTLHSAPPPSAATPATATAAAPAAAPSLSAQELAEALLALPAPLPQAWEAAAVRDADGSYRVALRPQQPDAALSSVSGETTTGAASEAALPNLAVEPVYFFPLSDDIAAGEIAAQRITRAEDGTVTFVLQPASASAAALASINGVFTSTNGWLASGGAKALLLEVPVLSPASAALLAAQADSENFAGWLTGPSAAVDIGSGGGLSLHLLVLAFVGGLILNLMPCVFPVLGIKVLGFVQQAGSERRKVVLHGLSFTGGVVLSFWVLSGVLIALRLGGAELGWGFQLQSPAFVAGLAVLLLVFGLSLSGLFDIGYGAMNVGSNLAAKSGLRGSFFSGVLATVVATPCAAPFLAPALGAALALSPLSSLLVFTVIALGLSAPYLILSAFPVLVGLLPRPGAWMETFKQFMAFLLYATVVYLVYVLAGLVKDERFLNMLFGFVAIAAACWAYGRWLQPGSKSRLRGWVWTLLFAALGGWLIFAPVRTLEWEDWSAERVAELQAQGRPIYVDFTARWCATCQVNKRVVFSSDAVLERFAKERVALLRADWTDRNAAITTELAKFGRSAVPFNLLYGGKGSALGAEPLILPEVLTPGIVLEALDKASQR